jgi:O-antigen ligase
LALLAGLLAFAPIILAIVVLAAIGVALVILVRPWIGVVLLGFVLPFAAVQPLAFGGLRVDGADLLLALVVATWLAQGVVRRAITLPRAPLTLPLAIFIGVIALSVIAASSWREALPELLKWVQLLLLYWCVAALLPPNRVGWLLAALLAAGVAEALTGIYQFLTQSGPEGFVLLGRFMRAFGTFRQPNPYAGYLGLAAPLAIALTLWAWTTPGSRPAAQRLLRLLLPATALIISAGLLVSWSRGAWLAFAAATAVVVISFCRRSMLLALMAAVLLLVGVLAVSAAGSETLLLPTFISERLGDLQDYLGVTDVQRVEINDANFAVIERVAHWVAAVSMWADHPWFGVGLGNYAVAYAAYALPRWQEALGHAHNVYLNFGAESGLLGLLAYLLLWLAAFWQSLKATRGRQALTIAVGAAVLGALVHATIHNVFDNLWVQHIVLQVGLLMGALAVLMEEEREVNHG